MKRKKIPLALRWKLLKEYGFECPICGEKDLSKLEVDHIVPFSMGGVDEKYNYQILCNKCNIMKSDDLFAEDYIKMRKESPKELYSMVSKIVLSRASEEFGLKEISVLDKEY